MSDSKLLVEYQKSSEQVFKGKLLDVYLDKVELPDGNTSTREGIIHPGACAIVPLFDNGDTLLIKQYRYAVKQIFWEVPAGKIDSKEDPLKTAERELKEETGLEAGNLEYIGHFYPCIGYSNEVIHIWLATDITESKENSDDDEFVIPEKMPFQEACEMIFSGEITDGKTVNALLRTQKYLQQKYSG